MQNIEQAYREVCRLHEQLTHSPPPEIGPLAFVPFPPGIDPVAFAMQEVSQLRQMLEKSPASGGATGPVSWVPRANMYASDSSVLLTVELPGVTREDVTVTVASGELIVRGQRRAPTTDSSQKPVVVEQSTGGFERRFPVPPWCNPEKISARSANGVLEISLRWTEEGQTGEFRVEIA